MWRIIGTSAVEGRRVKVEWTCITHQRAGRTESSPWWKRKYVKSSKGLLQTSLGSWSVKSGCFGKWKVWIRWPVSDADKPSQVPWWRVRGFFTDEWESEIEFGQITTSRQPSFEAFTRFAYKFQPTGVGIPDQKCVLAHTRKWWVRWLWHS